MTINQGKTIKNKFLWLEIAKNAFFLIWFKNSMFKNIFNFFVQTYPN